MSRRRRPSDPPADLRRFFVGFVFRMVLVCIAAVVIFTLLPKVLKVFTDQVLIR